MLNLQRFLYDIINLRDQGKQILGSCDYKPRWKLFTLNMNMNVNFWKGEEDEGLCFIRDVNTINLHRKVRAIAICSKVTNKKKFVID